MTWTWSRSELDPPWREGPGGEPAKTGLLGRIHVDQHRGILRHNGADPDAGRVPRDSEHPAETAITVDRANILVTGRQPAGLAERQLDLYRTLGLQLLVHGINVQGHVCDKGVLHDFARLRSHRCRPPFPDRSTLPFDPAVRPATRHRTVACPRRRMRGEPVSRCVRRALGRASKKCVILTKCRGREARPGYRSSHSESRSKACDSRRRGRFKTALDAASSARRVSIRNPIAAIGASSIVAPWTWR